MLLATLMNAFKGASRLEHTSHNYASSVTKWGKNKSNSYFSACSPREDVYVENHALNRFFFLRRTTSEFGNTDGMEEHACLQCAILDFTVAL